MDSQCVTCGNEIRPKQQYLPCDECKRSTHRCCGRRLKIDAFQYRKFRAGIIKVIFLCKLCTEKAGNEYVGEVHILNVPSADACVDLPFEIPIESIIGEIVTLLTPPKARLVDYSPSSTEHSLDSLLENLVSIFYIR